MQTKIPLQKQVHDQIDYDSKVLLLGSCFSENIAAKFNHSKLQCVRNPFGILFHPLAIENLIVRAINKSYYTQKELYVQNEQWFCLDAHSALNASSSEAVLQNLNSNLDLSLKALTEASHITITLGTSWVYRHIASDAIVANCHKLPQKQFLKTLLSVAEITASLEAIVSLVKSVNPKIVLVFTVSPVRHIKDGFLENTQSKAHLIAAIHQVAKPRPHLYYFPSYEIMMDELRDYRFYKADMLHPNQVAIDYIWEIFKSVWLSEEAFKTLETVTSIQNRKAHRPFNPNSEAHLKFLEILQIDIDTLVKNQPNINFDDH